MKELYLTNVNTYAFVILVVVSQVFGLYPHALSSEAEKICSNSDDYEKCIECCVKISKPRALAALSCDEREKNNPDVIYVPRKKLNITSNEYQEICAKKNIVIESPESNLKNCKKECKGKK